MLLLKAARCFDCKSVQIDMPLPNMVIDPRPNDPRVGRFRFDYHDNGTTVTITLALLEKRGYLGYYDDPVEFRAYDPATETVPDFSSTTYIYLGVNSEKAPIDTTVLVIDPSVKVIKEDAFENCTKIQICIMHDGVHTIEGGAFYGCSAMKFIRLSRSLKRIEECAFKGCTFLHALFLPPSLEEIEGSAFKNCTYTRILSLPPNIDISQMGGGVYRGCHNFFERTQIQGYQFQHQTQRYNDDEVHQSIIDFYHNLHPLHKACLSTNVNANDVNNIIATHGTVAASVTDHNGMTAMRILAMNPHADAGSILACFHANMNAVFVGENRVNTPLDYLMQYNLEAHTLVVAALCMHRDMTTRDGNNPS